jgi:four helix bundle protein
LPNNQGRQRVLKRWNMEIVKQWNRISFPLASFPLSISLFPLSPHSASFRYGSAKFETRTKKFALDLIDFVERMPSDRAGDVVGEQLLRSRASIGANDREANRAESKADFIHKLGISSPEAAEAAYWLELISESKHLEVEGVSVLLK